MYLCGRRPVEMFAMVTILRQTSGFVAPVGAAARQTGAGVPLQAEVEHVCDAVQTLSPPLIPKALAIRRTGEPLPGSHLESSSLLSPMLRPVLILAPLIGPGATRASTQVAASGPPTYGA